MTDSYLVWSHEHGAWWRENRCGYAVPLAAAGRYTREEAISICARARDGWPKNTAPTEIPVREADALECEAAAPQIEMVPPKSRKRAAP